MIRGLLTASLLLSAVCFGGDRIYFAKYEQSAEGAKLLQQGWKAGVATSPEVREVRYPKAIEEHRPVDQIAIVELTAPSREAVWDVLLARSVAPRAIDVEDFVPVDEEVRTLVNSGPPANRIDLVFMGDGYTEAEKEKFFADAQRLTDDMFVGETFRSYLPVFNVHAVFRASNESGIGKNSRPKDTAYGLYREGNTLRAIFPARPENARRSCQKAPDCDYPILMGNDPYYGGLGGEFAITTSSPTSGTKVLRHELGHNFGKVGEEYDGGGYFGANHASSLSQVRWGHWLSGTLRAEPAKALYIKWPWHHLQQGPFTARFRADGSYAYYEIQYSASGIETDETIEMTLNGTRIPTPSPGHKDREFVEMLHEGGLPAGTHEIVVREKVADGDNWLSDLTVFEYGSDYHFDPEHIGAYPVFSPTGSVMGYRGTHETCLMRNMKSTRFCPICKENNWLHFFAKITLIDGVEVVPTAAGYTVKVRVPALGQFREEPLEGETLDIQWIKNGQVVSGLSGQTEVQLVTEEAAADWRVRVQYRTPEVRKDPSSSLITERRVTLN